MRIFTRSFVRVLHWTPLLWDADAQHLEVGRQQGVFVRANGGRALFHDLLLWFIMWRLWEHFLCY